MVISRKNRYGSLYVADAQRMIIIISFVEIPAFRYAPVQ